MGDVSECDVKQVTTYESHGKYESVVDEAAEAELFCFELQVPEHFVQHAHHVEGSMYHLLSNCKSRRLPVDRLTAVQMVMYFHMPK